MQVRRCFDRESGGYGIGSHPDGYRQPTSAVGGGGGGCDQYETLVDAFDGATGIQDDREGLILGSSGEKFCLMEKEGIGPVTPSGLFRFWRIISRGTSPDIVISAVAGDQLSCNLSSAAHGIISGETCVFIDISSPATFVERVVTVVGAALSWAVPIPWLAAGTPGISDQVFASASLYPFTYGIDLFSTANTSFGFSTALGCSVLHPTSTEGGLRMYLLSAAQAWKWFQSDFEVTVDYNAGSVSDYAAAGFCTETILSNALAGSYLNISDRAMGAFGDLTALNLDVDTALNGDISRAVCFSVALTALNSSLYGAILGSTGRANEADTSQPDATYLQDIRGTALAVQCAAGSATMRGDFMTGHIRVVGP